jgi:hypothetical protein
MGIDVASLENEFIDSLIRLYRLTGDACVPGVGCARGELDGQLWQPVKHGIFMLTVGEYAGEELVDILAFPPSQPTRVYVRAGIAAIAGEDNLRVARLMREPILVHASMLDYIRSGLTGCYLFDGDYGGLLDVKHIRVNDADLAGRIYRAHRAPPPHLPKISVRQPGDHSTYSRLKEAAA